MLYRDFATQAEIDAQYHVSLRRPDYAEVERRMAELSAGVRRDHPAARLGVRFGATLSEHLDVFCAGAPEAGGPRPVLVFIHGGYWRAGNAADWSLVATGPNAHGIDVAVTNYTLAPAASIDEITRQSRAAVAWLHAHAAEWGGDPNRIHVAGHSAGGHLTAMVLATDWAGDYGLPADLVKGGVPLSGLYDLRPFPYSYLAPALQLSRRTVETQSPLLLPVDPARAHVPRIVAWGGGETDEFVRQSRAYAAHCRAAGIEVRELPLGADDHFDAVLQLADPDSELTRAITEHVSLR
ncbi:MAG TPA: alpha/beta hydrolase [Solirubrobacteraceae bacterium]|nr:alpha/beta hydrolase [Solirubrobacteraceae bacterium]